MRRRRARLPAATRAGARAPGIWLDGALGAAGGATALAAFLGPALTGSAGDVGSLLVGAAYSTGDLLLIAMICGVLAVRGMRGGSMWAWLAVGFATFCAADVSYAVRVARRHVVLGSAWSMLWMVGLSVMAFALWRPERATPLDPVRPTALLAIPMLATVTAVVVLIVSANAQLPVAVTALATCTLGLAAARAFVSFRQVQRLSDSHRLAVTDELTGLGNRRALFEFGAQRLDDAQPDERTALMLIDLDDFKEVNDSLGHHAGDELLRETARRIAGPVRRQDLLVRLGGDEFALMAKLAPGDDGRESADRMLDRLREPLVIDGMNLRIDASVGIAESEGGRHGVPELLRRADVAMYAAKGSGPHASSTTSSSTKTSAPGTPRSAISTRRCSGTSSCSTTSRRSTSRRARSSEPRPWCAGSIRRAACSTPTRSCRSSNRAASWAQLTRSILKAAIAQMPRGARPGSTIGVAVNLSSSDLLDEGPRRTGSSGASPSTTSRSTRSRSRSPRPSS